MTFSETITLLKHDLRGYAEPFWKAAIFIPGYKYTVHHRLCYYFYQHWYTKPLFVIWRLYMMHLTWKFGFQTAWNRSLPEYTTIAYNW